jgi:NADH dehydrogenase [ubiquinone] 1 alpha subcomplex assembly factor 2
MWHRTIANKMKIAQWHQWLRHTRFDPPSIAEQAQDIQRIANTKRLAQLADERWASKASYLDAPKERLQQEGLVGSQREDLEQAGPGTMVADSADVGDLKTPNTTRATSGGSESSNKPRKPIRRGTEDRTKGIPSAPGEDWQPEGWSPAPARPRR